MQSAEGLERTSSGAQSVGTIDFEDLQVELSCTDFVDGLPLAWLVARE
jgi:hypothetical protein